MTDVLMGRLKFSGLAIAHMICLRALKAGAAHEVVSSRLDTPETANRRTYTSDGVHGDVDDATIYLTVWSSVRQSNLKTAAPPRQM